MNLFLIFSCFLRKETVFLKNAPLKHDACYKISSASVQNRLNRTNTVKLR